MEEEDGSESGAQRIAEGTGCAAPSLEIRLREAAGLLDSPAPALRNTAPIAALIEGGTSLESVILPTLRAKAAAGKRGSSWAYYVQAIREAKPAAPPGPALVVTTDVFVHADSDEGRAWEAHWREHPAHRKKWFQCNAGFGRSMPSRWPSGHLHPTTDRAA